LTARGIFPTVRMRELFGLWRSPTILYSFIWCQCYKILSGITVAGKSYWRGRLSTVDLLVLTSLYQLLFISKILFTFLKKYNRRSTVLSLPPHLVFPDCSKACFYVRNFDSEVMFNNIDTRGQCY
jgi:hypothetical protein